ncbi:pantoate--beta-alanine ligase [Clostridium sp. N3C]|uniref:pantoate--beta-alanine ligase n=1 Tax=Clostridium sp. N3C TaxID=1776758 RepID=UPI0015BDE0E0|nr:pantoate--beta-alanine ligase [Clostridium sp. N3C]
MMIFHRIEEVKDQINSWKKAGLSIGFVPTMGYLHEGHCSLIKRASMENDKVVVSIFVNPIQFNVKDDLDTYPRDLERDVKKVLESGGHLIFNPSVEEMYPSNFSTFIEVEGLTDELCGRSRPGHFRGVCTVVTKLFNIVTPTRAYFGEKDAQQLAVIKRMVEDLNMDIEIIACPIVREEDGLAKSSRNVHLNPQEREAAVILSKSLLAAKDFILEGNRDSETIITYIKSILEKEPLCKIDYVEIVDSVNLKPVEKVNKPVLIALAAFFGKTRLIDNITINV